MQNSGSFSPIPSISSPADLAQFIDHTLLKPETTSTEIERLCREARENKFKAVCVNPNFVALAKEFLTQSPVLIASVIGFPLGVSRSIVKAKETELAVKDGASEIDMVIRIDLVKEESWKGVTEDIAAVVSAGAGANVKVILETGLLTVDEVIRACACSEEAGAAFVKTATGFLGRGATVDDIKLMRKSCSAKMQIKASGGVKTFEQAVAMISAGATRIGTSSGVALVRNQTAAPNTY